MQCKCAKRRRRYVTNRLFANHPEARVYSPPLRTPIPLSPRPPIPLSPHPQSPCPPTPKLYLIFFIYLSLSPETHRKRRSQRPEILILVDPPLLRKMRRKGKQSILGGGGSETNGCLGTQEVGVLGSHHMKTLRDGACDYCRQRPSARLFPRPALSGGMDWCSVEWPLSRVRRIFFTGQNLHENLLNFAERELLTTLQAPRVSVIPYPQPFHTPSRFACFWSTVADSDLEHMGYLCSV